MVEEITYKDFLKVDIRIGTVLSAKENFELKKPSLILSFP